MSPRRRHISEALAAIGAIASIEQTSTPGETDDITSRGAPYVNVVVKCSTSMNFGEFSKTLTEIEKAGGRTPDSRLTGIVALDIDIIIWNDEVLASDDFHHDYFLNLYRQLKAE